MKQKITSITAQKRPGRFNVFLDGNYAFSVSEEVLVKFQLAKGKELDSADLEEIFEADDLAQEVREEAEEAEESVAEAAEAAVEAVTEAAEEAVDAVEESVKEETEE